LRESTARRLDAGEGFAQKFFLVEGGNDDGNFHQASLTRGVGRFKRQNVPGPGGHLELQRNVAVDEWVTIYAALCRNAATAAGERQGWFW